MRTFEAILEPTAVTTAIDIFELLAPASSGLIILEWNVYQITDVGDAAEEILDLETVRGDGSVTSGSGGSSVTPQPIDNGDGSAGATVEAANTTRMAVGTGTLDIGRKLGWNVRSEYNKVYIPELRPQISPSDRWTLSLDDAPADSITLGASIVFAEIFG